MVRRFLVCATFVCAGEASVVSASADAVPNVLFISMDDMNWDSVGAYGCSIPRISPNIDALARGGMRFEYAFNQTSGCVPSRTRYKPRDTSIRDEYPKYWDYYRIMNGPEKRGTVTYEEPLNEFGSVDRDVLVSAIDFLPTVLVTVGVEPLDRLPGRSSLPTLMGERQEWPELAYTESNDTVGEHPFPMRADPRAMENLIDDPD